MLLISSLSLIALALALAYAKGTSTVTRPRGRFAPSIPWNVVPPVPAAAPRVRRRAVALARSLEL
jgi:hypothetical protein